VSQRHEFEPGEEAVLEAARACVLAVGVRRTTFSDVARRAGVSRMTLYRRFPDLETLLSTLMTWEFGRVVDDAREAGADAVSVREHAVAMVAAAARRLHEDPLFDRLLDVDPELLLPYVTVRLGGMQRLAIAGLAAELEAGRGDGSVREGDAETLARGIELIARGFDAVSFAYPYGLFDAATAHTVRSCGYLSARTSGSLSPGGPLYASPAPPADPYATPTLSQEREGPQTLSYLQSAVRAAAAHGGGWLQVVFHQVCRSSDRDYAQCMRSHRPVDFAVLSDFLYWLRYSAPPATSVKTVRAVLNPN